MSLSLIAVCAFITVLAVLITSIRVVGLRRVLRNATIFDVAFTIAIGILLGGTATGLMIALTAGLVAALTLSAGQAAMNAYDNVMGRFKASRDAATDDLPSSGDWAVL